MTSRRPSCSQVITKSSSPAAIPRSASAAHGSTSSHASGAPSSAWRGRVLASRQFGFDSADYPQPGLGAIACVIRHRLRL
jgi:hypothetical protein